MDAENPGVSPLTERGAEALRMLDDEHGWDDRLAWELYPDFAHAGGDVRAAFVNAVLASGPVVPASEEVGGGSDA